MNLVEQDRRYARQFRIVLNAADEYPLGQHQQARACRLPTVHARGIADHAARLVAYHFGDPLCRCPCRQPTRRQ